MDDSSISFKHIFIVFVLLLSSRNFCQSGTLALNSGLYEPALKGKIILEDSFPLTSVPEINFDPLNKKIDYGILTAVGGVTLATGIAVHIYQMNAWWKDQRRKFHFTNDNLYALEIDKVGHFYAANLLAHLFSSGLEAANFQSEQAALYGSIASLAFETYVEIEDGFGPDWGFSPEDFTSDFLGAGFSLGQYYFPFLKDFQIKFSYYPSEKFREGLHKGNSIDDYEGQKYWLSLRVKNLLPEPVSKFWPAFLNIAGGIGVKDLDGNGGGQREFYISLDLDTEQIPLYGGVWQFVKNSFNYVHFPMPGLRITPDAVFFVFCY
ncbi:MAG TPA: DUF2279 domain-containing protein [Ignavibacteriaceae bacterium]|nr:DUF2279 domain-containing protein [Ignavibacteriaceae bacterium]